MPTHSAEPCGTSVSPLPMLAEASSVAMPTTAIAARTAAELRSVAGPPDAHPGEPRGALLSRIIRFLVAMKFR